MQSSEYTQQQLALKIHGKQRQSGPFASIKKAIFEASEAVRLARDTANLAEHYYSMSDAALASRFLTRQHIPSLLCTYFIARSNIAHRKAAAF